MRTILSFVFFLLFAPAAGAQTTISVNINKAVLSWEWTAGAAPDNGLPDEFRVKCGTATKVYTKITTVAGSSARSVAVGQAITGSGTWFCVVTAANEFGESGASNELNFAAGAAPSAPTNLVVTAK